MQHDFHSRRLQLLLQRINHVVRVIRCGEGPAAALNLGCQPPRLEKSNDVLRIHDIQSAVEKARVGHHIFQELVPGAVICEVTAALAGDEELFSQLFILFKQSDGVAFAAQQDGGHHAGGAAADDDYFAHVFSFLGIRFISKGKC